MSETLAAGSAAPLRSPRPAAPGGAGATAGAGALRFWRRLERLRDRHVALWLDTPAALPGDRPKAGWLRRLANARDARRLIDDLATEIQRYPDEGAPGEQAAWRGRVKARVRAFGETTLGWPRGYRDLLLDDGFEGSTVTFVREARRFDPEVSAEDLFQALRNVWIANSVQMLLDRPVACTPAVFAYSMLYPYTDNALDDPDLASHDKRALCRRLDRRLCGERLPPRLPGEAQVFRLVARIERQWARRHHPEVWLGLLAIHRAQVRSLDQHGGGPADPRRLLEISADKGGASVLADAYLVAGRLTPDEEDFMFGYGVALQLLDDFQDAETDRRAGHRTLFSVLAGRRPADARLGRLLRYIDRVIDGSPRFAAPRHAPLRDLIRRNCTQMLLAAAAERPRLLGGRFRRRLDLTSALSFRAVRHLRRRAERRIRETRQRLGPDRARDLAGTLLR